MGHRYNRRNFRALYPVGALLALALLAALMWPRPAARASYAYSVAGIVALMQAHPNALRGRAVAVDGFYHHGCPSCIWDAPPSLTPGSSWAGPSLLVDLADAGPAAGEPVWLAQWRALPLLGRLAPPAPRAGLAEGFLSFTGAIVPCPAGTCGNASFIIRVLSVRS